MGAVGVNVGVEISAGPDVSCTSGVTSESGIENSISGVEAKPPPMDDTAAGVWVG